MLAKLPEASATTLGVTVTTVVVVEIPPAGPMLIGAVELVDVSSFRQYLKGKNHISRESAGEIDIILRSRTAIELEV